MIVFRCSVKQEHLLDDELNLTESHERISICIVSNNLKESVSDLNFGHIWIYRQANDPKDILKSSENMVW